MKLTHTIKSMFGYIAFHERRCPWQGMLGGLGKLARTSFITQCGITSLMSSVRQPSCSFFSRYFGLSQRPLSFSVFQYHLQSFCRFKWFVIRALHLPSGLKSEDVMHGAQRQKSQVDSKTCDGEATPDSLLSQMATASLFLRGKRQTGDGRSGSSIFGTAKRFLAAKKKIQP